MFVRHGSQFVIAGKKKELIILTPKALTSDQSQTLANPRSRSAKLRAGEKS